VWRLYDAEVFMPLRQHDRARFSQGLAWDGGITALAAALLGAAPAPPPGPVASVPERGLRIVAE
jgi:hypothetical protein